MLELRGLKFPASDVLHASRQWWLSWQARVFAATTSKLPATGRSFHRRLCKDGCVLVGIQLASNGLFSPGSPSDSGAWLKQEA